MDVEGVARELRRLNGDHPIFNPARSPDTQATVWIVWSAGENLIRKWEEQAQKRTRGAQEQQKAAESTSTIGGRSQDMQDFIGRPSIE